MARGDRKKKKLRNPSRQNLGNAVVPRSVMDAATGDLAAAGLPPGSDPASAFITEQHVQWEGTTGPLPPPGMLARYNDVVTNGAERLFKMVEDQAAHRQGCERTLVDSRTHNETAGTWLGFAAFAAALAVGAWFVVLGHEAAGIGLLTAQLGGGIFVRVHGHKAIVDAIRKAQRPQR